MEVGSVSRAIESALLMAVKRFIRFVSAPSIMPTIGFSISMCDVVEKDEFAKAS
jgi:hypothetical protein